MRGFIRFCDNRLPNTAIVVPSGAKIFLNQYEVAAENDLYFRDLSIVTRSINFGDSSRRRSSVMRPLRLI